MARERTKGIGNALKIKDSRKDQTQQNAAGTLNKFNGSMFFLQGFPK
jgi:hypothetical protein